MIVWGGYSGNTQYGDGAAYDPATRTWTKLAASPLAGQDLPVTVWTGKDMLIFGGSGTSGASSNGAAYNPATNTWRKLAPIPASLGGNLTGSGSYAVWTGKVMVAWGFFGAAAGGRGEGRWPLRPTTRRRTRGQPGRRRQRRLLSSVTPSGPASR